MKIELTEEQARNFAWGDMLGFTHVDTVEYVTSIYKEMMDVETVCKEDSTGKFYKLFWRKSLSHFSGCEHQYDALDVQEVEEFQVVKVATEWRAV